MEEGLQQKVSDLEKKLQVEREERGDKDKTRVKDYHTRLQRELDIARGRQTQLELKLRRDQATLVELSRVQREEGPDAVVSFDKSQ